MKGKEDNPLRIHIEGNAGNDFGFGSEYTEFIILNNAGKNLGKQSKHSSYTVLEDVGEYLGKNSRYCRFQVNGKTPYSLTDESLFSTYILNEVDIETPIEEKIGLEIVKYPREIKKPDRTTKIITTNKETYGKLLSAGITPTECDITLEER